jgi:hypothetical protein
MCIVSRIACIGKIFDCRNMHCTKNIKKKKVGCFTGKIAYYHEKPVMMAGLGTYV